MCYDEEILSRYVNCEDRYYCFENCFKEYELKDLKYQRN